MSKEQLINKLSSIKQFFKGKDRVKFAEIYCGGKLLPYQKLILRALYLKENINCIISRSIQKELNFTAKAKLTHAIGAAILGKKMLFMDANKNTNMNIRYIENFIECNKEMFEKHEISYVVEDNIIKFNTEGSIEFYNKSK